MRLDRAKRHAQSIGDELMGPPLTNREFEDPSLIRFEPSQRRSCMRGFISNIDFIQCVWTGDGQFINGRGFVDGSAGVSSTTVDQSTPRNHRHKRCFGSNRGVESRRILPNFDEDLLHGIFGFRWVIEEAARK